MGENSPRKVARLHCVLTLMTGAASKQPEKPSGTHHKDVEGALAAVWEEIEEGARHRLKENQEKLQELYESEQKPTLVGHVEEHPQLKADDKQLDDELDRPPQQTKSIFSVETEEQLQEVLQEQCGHDNLDQQVAQHGGRGMSDIDLEAEMEKGVQADELAGSET